MLAEQRRKQSFGSLKPFLRENHRLGLALWVRDVAFFVQPIHSVPVKTLPRAGSVVQAKIQQGTCPARVYLESNTHASPAPGSTTRPHLPQTYRSPWLSPWLCPLVCACFSHDIITAIKTTHQQRRTAWLSTPTNIFRKRFATPSRLGRDTSWPTGPYLGYAVVSAPCAGRLPHPCHVDTAES